jgi:HEPN domain-containing protein
MADPLIVQEWLQMAEDDFCFAETNLKAGSEFYSQICFHFQQSAEKYLKAYIIAKGLAFEKVHDLVHLLKTCSAYEPAFAALKEDCILLNTAYIETRYPVHWPTSYEKETAEQSHSAAVNIARMVRNQL